MDINKNTLLIITKNPLFAGMDSGQAEKAVSLLDGTVSAYKKGEFVHGAAFCCTKNDFLCALVADDEPYILS